VGRKPQSVSVAAVWSDGRWCWLSLFLPLLAQAAGSHDKKKKKKNRAQVCPFAAISARGIFLNLSCGGRAGRANTVLPPSDVSRGTPPPPGIRGLTHPPRLPEQAPKERLRPRKSILNQGLEERRDRGLGGMVFLPSPSTGNKEKKNGQNKKAP